MGRRKKSAASVTKATAITQGLQGGDPRNPRKKPERIPMSQGMNLAIDEVLETEDYFYRWFSEKGGRVQRAKKAGYEICADEEGNSFTRPSGNDVLILMRLPMGYHLEDKARKREKVRATLDKHTRLGPNEYAPTKTHREGGESSVVEHRESDNPYAS